MDNENLVTAVLRTAFLKTCHPIGRSGDWDQVATLFAVTRCTDSSDPSLFHCPANTGPCAGQETLFCFA